MHVIVDRIIALDNPNSLMVSMLNTQNDKKGGFESWSKRNVPFRCTTVWHYVFGSVMYGPKLHPRYDFFPPHDWPTPVGRRYGHQLPANFNQLPTPSLQFKNKTLDLHNLTIYKVWGEEVILNRSSSKADHILSQSTHYYKQIQLSPLLKQNKYWCCFSVSIFFLLFITVLWRVHIVVVSCGQAVLKSPLSLSNMCAINLIAVS